MNGMSLDKILEDLKKASPAVETKTAAAKTETAQPSKVAQAKDELVQALRRAETASTKTAAAAEAPAATPVTELEKVAADLAAADQEALVKEAQFYGAAIADGFMARLQQYEKAAESLPAAEKTASAPADVEKIASEAVRGYVETQHAIKVAADREFNRGYQDTLKEVEKIASDMYGQGAHDAAAVLEKIAAEA